MITFFSGMGRSWLNSFSKFWKDAEQLSLLIENTPDDKLDQNFIHEKYGTYQKNMDGMIEHCYYHLGQIVLIKKLLTKNN